MERFILEQFKKEFPFLGEVEKVDIQRLDENLMSKHFEYRSWDGSMGSDESNFQIDFVLNNEEIIKNAVQIGENVGSNYAHSSSSYCKGETIIEAIDRHNVPERLKYIVLYEWGYSNWEGCPIRNWNKATIYKAPKDKPLNEILEEFKIKAREEVIRKISF